MQFLINFLKNLIDLKQISYQLKINTENKIIGILELDIKYRFNKIKTEYILNLFSGRCFFKRSSIKKQLELLNVKKYDIFNFSSLIYKHTFLLKKSEITQKNFVGQFINSYIILNINNIFFIIDKHALHERIILDFLGENSDENKNRACRGAIKFNEKTTDEKLKYLLDRFKTVRNPFICAHGRPTIIHIKK